MNKELFSLNDLASLFDWQAALYLFLTIAILLVSKSINQLLAGYKIDYQLTEVDNKAVAVSFAGFLLALSLILNGVLTSPYISRNITIDLFNTCIWATLGCVLLLLSRIVNDKLLLPKFSNRKELISDKNVGVGAVQAGSYIATAIIIRGVIIDSGFFSFGIELLLTLIWFIATQLLFILYAKVYAKLISYSLHEELERNNVAAGISFGGSLIALGILLSFYLQYYDSLIGIIIWGFFTVIFLRVVRVITDKLLFPQNKLGVEISEDQNWGVACIEATTSIGVALILTGSLF